MSEPTWTWGELDAILGSMEELQVAKVLDLARRLKPGLTLEDVRNPHDFPELADPDWHYEDGILTGIQSARTALRARQRRDEGGGGRGRDEAVSKKKEKLDPSSPFAKLAVVKEELAKKDAAKAPSSPRAGARPAATPQATPRASSSEDERLDFHRMMSGVTPLDNARGRVSPKEAPRTASPAAKARAEEASRAAAAEAEEVHARLRELVQGDKQFETHDDGRRVEGRRIDVPQATLRKLRHGTFPVDARVDLHGLDATEARATVESFLRDKRVAGERCVLIVHGKGEHSPRGRGVLRLEIAGWLAEGTASEHVAAFATATNDDGGEGAVYVMLRR